MNYFELQAEMFRDCRELLTDRNPCWWRYVDMAIFLPLLGELSFPVSSVLMVIENATAVLQIVVTTFKNKTIFSAHFIVSIVVL